MDTYVHAGLCVEGGGGGGMRGVDSCTSESCSFVLWSVDAMKSYPLQ